MNEQERIHLSVPHMGELEAEFVRDALESNWIAPLGPHVEAFEREFCEVVGAPYALALGTGTAALHLAFKLIGLQPGDEVLVSTLTFAATVNPILYEGGRPVFIDSALDSWNVDPELVEHALHSRAKAGRLPKGVVVVHLYGQPANVDPLVEVCAHYGVPLIEDAAESLGASYRGQSPGTFGSFGVYSFNGNKMITTSGGGMLVSGNEDSLKQARKLATQAREPFPHYEHREIGYNYRLSNILAAIGRGQLRVLAQRVDARRRNFARYARLLSDLPGLQFMPEAEWGLHSRWLTTLTVDPDEFGADREDIRLALEAENIEARPLWKPMHQQPVFEGYECIGGEVANELFDHGLCLPSSSNLRTDQIDRIVDIVREVGVRKRGRIRSGAHTPLSGSGKGIGSR